jgi:hypothetical protein
MKEIWKPVVGYEGFYEISNLGRVKSLSRFVNRSRGGKQLKKERILIPSIGRYLKVSLSKRGIIKNERVHKLVATSFIGPRPNGMVIDHINNIQHDTLRN